MFNSRTWPHVLAAVAWAASAAAQDPLDIETYVDVVLRSHPRAAETRAATVLVATEKRLAGALPDPEFGIERGRATPFPLLGDTGTEWDYSLSQTLPWPGARAARIRAAEFTGRERMLQEETARWNLALEARVAFWRLAQARRSLQQAEQLDVDAASVLDITTRRADVGEIREADRSRARAERLHAQLGLKAAAREAAAAETALRALAREPLPTQIALPDEPAPPMDAEAIGGVRSMLVSRSGALRAAQAAVDREAALASAARAGRVPDLGVSVSRVKELDKRTWAFGAHIRIPVFNGSRAEVARAEAAASLERARLTRLTLEVGLAFDAAVQQAAGADDRLRFLTSTLVPTARRTWELVRLSYEEGETSLLDLLDAQRTLRDAQIEEATARFDAAKAWVEVERISGPRVVAGDKK